MLGSSRHESIRRRSGGNDDSDPARRRGRRERPPRAIERANSGWIVITVGWGVAVTIAVYSVGRISGAHLNPAVTIALAAIGSFPWVNVAGYVAAQMVGVFLGAVLAWLAYLPHWRLRRSGHEAGRVLHRTGSSQHHCELRDGSDRDGDAAVRCPRHRRQR